MSTNTLNKNMSPEALSVLNFIDDSDFARKDRMLQNNQNFNAYHLKQDYSHKKAGQSREFLAKQPMAVETVTSFIQQGLVDIDKWFSVEDSPGREGGLIKADEVEKLLNRQLKHNKYVSHVADEVKLGLLGSLMITKVHGVSVLDKTFFIDKEDNKRLKKKIKNKWQLKYSLIRQEDYYPDPTGDGMGEAERIYVDKYKLMKKAKEHPELFNMDVIKGLEWTESAEQKNRKSAETGQNVVTDHKTRKRLELFEYWGDILDPTTQELLHEDVTCVISRDGQMVSKPRKNPFWHGERPFVVSPIIRVPHSVWHKALMDAPTRLGEATNELFNLMLDSGIMDVFGIKQLREHWLDDPSQVDDGIVPGDTLSVNQQCPPNGKVLERVDTGSLSNDSTNMFHILSREIQASSLTNDTRLGGLPQRQTKATEIIASNQSITGIFNGVVKLIEKDHIARELELGWKVMAQHMDDLSSPEVVALLGQDRAHIIQNMSREEIFVDTVNGTQFNVFGLSTTLNRIQDFQKIVSLLQTVATSPILMQVFLKKFSGSKLLMEIMKALDIDVNKIKLDEEEAKTNEGMIDQLKAEANPGTPGGDQQSQISQVADRKEDTGIDLNRSELSTQSRA